MGEAGRCAALSDQCDLLAVDEKDDTPWLLPPLAFKESADSDANVVSKRVMMSRLLVGEKVRMERFYPLCSISV
jgi:hypothetical protein